jgi:hypothetical protein
MEPITQAVIFDGTDAAEVHVPHGTYRVERTSPGSLWHYRTDDGDGGRIELVTTRGGEATHFSGFGSRPGQVPLELLDAVVLAAVAFRDRDARKAA